MYAQRERDLLEQLVARGTTSSDPDVRTIAAEIRAIRDVMARPIVELDREES